MNCTPVQDMKICKYVQNHSSSSCFLFHIETPCCNSVVKALLSHCEGEGIHLQ